MDREGPNYSVGYTYTAYGDRASAHYATPNTNAAWAYRDYVVVGPAENPKHAFQTLVKLDALGNDTAEEFDYLYDTDGRLLASQFAQTPAAGQTNYDVQAPQSYAQSLYSYDSGGRITSLETDWVDSVNGNQTIYRNECGYELTGASGGFARGLKTSSTVKLSDGANGWTTQRVETYAYDPGNDYLIGASYGDGQPNANVSWTYDAAGNRSSDSAQAGTWSYDNLNRMTASPQGSYTHDILGNRLTGPSSSMAWDLLNRMASLTNGSGTTNYAYRADGMRVLKSNASSSTQYRYDGQTAFETVQGSTVSNQVLGARGVDAEFSNGSITYPVYDAHGNRVATLARGAVSGYTVTDTRSYDAWGGLRSGNPQTPGRYCASIGHVQDDESGLIYMRARYYESSSGRFVREDSARCGLNWYVYARNCPTTRIDVTGNDDQEYYQGLMICIGVLFLLSSAVTVAAKWLVPLGIVTAYYYSINEELNALGANNLMKTGGFAVGVVTAAAIKRFGVDKAFNTIFGELGNALGFAGNAEYFGALALAMVTISVQAMVVGAELILDSQY